MSVVVIVLSRARGGRFSLVSTLWVSSINVLQPVAVHRPRQRLPPSLAAVTCTADNHPPSHSLLPSLHPLFTRSVGGPHYPEKAALQTLGKCRPTRTCHARAVSLTSVCKNIDWDAALWQKSAALTSAYRDVTVLTGEKLLYISLWCHSHVTDLSLGWWWRAKQYVSVQ